MTLLPLVRERDALEASLIEFVEAAWPSIDPSEYQPSWAIDALCEHLQAVTEGKIKRLLVNFPPRAGKSSVVSICWPAWTWARRKRGFLSGPQVKFLCASYNHDLSLQMSNRTRRLILSPWYQKYWGKRVVLLPDQNTKAQFEFKAGGLRIATSVGGSLLGIGGDIINVDDPHNTADAESEAERKTVLAWWSELRSTRLNNPRLSAVVATMQRLHEDDVSGSIIAGDEAGEWVHLMLPMRHEISRHCVVPVMNWEDPRTEEGELLWPERFGEKEVASLERELGPYMASGRLQQSPIPDKGGIFDRSWWQLYESADGKYPPFDHVIASLDSAFTEKEQNDPSGLTIWGVFRHDAKLMGMPGSELVRHEGQRRIMLIHAWRKHLAFSGPRIDREPQESIIAYKQRVRGTWGLMEWVSDTCTRFKIDKLLIEAKASGISAGQELRNRYGLQEWAIQLCPVRGDKVARALAVQPMFSQGMIFAPARQWAEDVITEMSVFPMGRYDDLTDSATQALLYLRGVGLAQTDEEEYHADMQGVMHRPQPKPLYPV